MKILLLALALLLSSQVNASEREFHCEARYLFGAKEKASLAGSITSETSLLDVAYSIDDQPEFNAGVLTIDKKAVRKYPFYQKFNVDGGYALYMPDRMDSMFHFTAIVEKDKASDKLECFVESIE
nr:hypothetical protein BHI3_31240 [Bacteriovorax sp. HI3]